MILQPVILSGGSGTRLWPLSRDHSPKQLLALAGERTMLQDTALRLSGRALPAGAELAPPLVVSNEQYRFITAEQLREAGVEPAAIVLEPAGRNTAPALTVAALEAAAAGTDPVLLVMPADHLITDADAFAAALGVAAAAAAEGRVVTFGVVPTAPETGYGYIQAGESLAGARAIARFVEKPDLATAKAWVDSGDFLWNSGIFVLRASVWLERIGAARPDILTACQAAIAGAARDADFLRLDPEAFGACPSESIDYAVMEVLEPGSGVVVPLDAGWSDVGAWGALHAVGRHDADGNLLQGDVLALDTRDSLVRAESRLVACLGLEGAVVVETADAVLVADREHLHRLRDVVARLKAQGRSETVTHRKVHRPWGHYDSIDAGARFQVKRIVVKPGSSLSLQMHHHRAEHWIVVRGTARITRGDEVFMLGEDQSTYIPLGTRHRLENPGRIPLEMIEVQSGSYLGEDDIVRFDDSYGRA